MALNRWDWLERLKKESAIQVAVKYMAELVAEELTSWPPEVTSTSGKPSRFAELFEPESPRPSLSAYEEALRRARWELSRDFEAIDFYERNHHLARACPEPRNQLASEFIQHYVLESFFVLMERTEYRVKRPDALVGIDLLEKQIKLMWLSRH
jgi:hypothetical protein